MSETPRPVSVPVHLRGWSTAAVLVVALLAASLAWIAARRPLAQAPQRVLLLDPVLDKGSGLSVQEAAVITDLVEDVLDVQGRRAVSRLPEVPALHEWSSCNKEGVVLRLHPRRIGQRLRLDASYISAADLRRGGLWIRHDSRALLPSDALDDLLKFLPGRAIRPDRRLLPTHPAGFWDYVGLNARLGHEGPQETLLVAAKAAADLEPASAAWQLFRGRIHLARAMRPRGKGSEDVNQAIACCTRALELCPGYPFAVSVLARLRIESGAPREALAMLQDAHRRRPHSIPVLQAVAYASRYTGLQSVARGASEALDEAYLHPGRTYPFQMAYLYSGDRERFLQSLWPAPGTPWNSILTFYRGYAALLANRHEEALAAFRDGSQDRSGDPRAQEMAQLFLGILENRLDEARPLLARMAEEQTRSRLPDAEVTLNLAEAQALLGDPDRAMDLVHQAFIQGFGNTAWLKASPFLEPVRSMPRWTALERYAEERMTLLEQAFPLESWGF